jgi:lambda family phage portal protein
MGIFSRIFGGKKADKPVRQQNPWRNADLQARSFFSSDSGRYFEGWDTRSNSIDYYLQTELTKLRARARRLVRMNPLGKRYVSLIKSNVVGPEGIMVQAQSLYSKSGKLELDAVANDAIESAFWDWTLHHADWQQKRSFIDLQNMAASNAAQDGEFIFRKHYGRSAGKYGFQLQSIDPELLDTEKNTLTKGGEIRLGVEYDETGRIVRYWFRERTFNGDYSTSKTYSVAAKFIIHGFLPEWPDQSRGIPWMHAGLETAKHLEKYNEAAIVASRAKAGTMAFISSKGTEEYKGGEDGSAVYGDGTTLEQFDPGTIKDIGERQFTAFDPNYPHQMYDSFLKGQQRDIASGWGIAFHALTNNLEGVNYSSIRAGVLEDREQFKTIQNWLIRELIGPVYEEWLLAAYTMGAIKIGRFPLNRPIEQYMPHSFQPRRWAWVDPQKDGAANELAINLNLKSRSQIIREQGDDPESVFREIQREREMLEKMGIPIDTENQPNEPEEQTDTEGQP